MDRISIRVAVKHAVETDLEVTNCAPVMVPTRRSHNISHRGYPRLWPSVCLPYFHEVRTPKGMKARTLGQLIENGNRAYGKSRARGIVRLAAKTRLIMYQEHARLMIS
jgi:hypothetical protein